MDSSKSIRSFFKFTTVILFVTTAVILLDYLLTRSRQERYLFNPNISTTELGGSLYTWTGGGGAPNIHTERVPNPEPPGNFVLQLTVDSISAYSGLEFAVPPDFISSLNDELQFSVMNKGEKLLASIHIAESSSVVGAEAEDWFLEIPIETNTVQDFSIPIHSFLFNAYYQPGGERGNNVIDHRAISQLTISFSPNTSANFSINSIRIYSESYSWVLYGLLFLFPLWCIVLLYRKPLTTIGDETDTLQEWIKYDVYLLLTSLSLIGYSRFSVSLSALFHPVFLFGAISVLDIAIGELFAPTKRLKKIKTPVTAVVITSLLLLYFHQSPLVLYLVIVQLLPLIIDAEIKGILFAVVCYAFSFAAYVYGFQAAPPSFVLSSSWVIFLFLILLSLYSRYLSSSYHYHTLEEKLDHLSSEHSRVSGYYQASLQNMLDGFALFAFAVDHTQRSEFACIKLNPAAKEILDYPNDPVQPVPLKTFFPDGVQSGLVKRFEQVIQSDEPVFISQYQYTRTDGTRILDGVLYKVIDVIAFIFRDVTEKVSMEKQVRQSQKMDAVGQLAGGVAHNINNLLTGILGNIELAKMCPGPTSNAYLTDAFVATQRASGLIRQLLTFTKKTDSVFKPLPVHQIVDEVTSLFQATIDKRIEMIVDKQVPSPFVSADASQIHSVIMNLCLNARDSIDLILRGERFHERQNETFQILVQTETVVLDEDKILCSPSAIKADSYIKISVSDNGTGIKPEHQMHIFEPFFSTKSTVGIGLGLASAYGIIRQHHGWIDFNSEYGIGTTFCLYLPEIHVAESGEVIDFTTDDLPVGEGHILLVDDEDIVRNMARKMLERHNYSVRVASDGREGLESFIDHADAINLVLLDLSMPKLSGLEVLKQIRERGYQTKVIICSGYNEMIPRDTLLSYGPIDFINKPYEMNKFIRKVHEVISSGD